MALFKDINDGFTVKVAESIDEACKLVEVGFEYVCEMENKKLFRKRKQQATVRPKRPTVWWNRP